MMPLKACPDHKGAVVVYPGSEFCPMCEANAEIVRLQEHVAKLVHERNGLQTLLDMYRANNP